MTLLSELRPSTGTELFGPTSLHLVTPTGAPPAGGADRRDVVDLTTVRGTTGATAKALADCVVLHGWLAASAVVSLLTLLDTPSTLRVRAAVEHAARSTDRAAPGSAALCGLARALLSAVAVRQRLTRDVVERARRLTIGLAPFPVNGPAAALHAIVALAAQRPDEPGIVAPLFLRQHWLRAGSTLQVAPQVPLMVISGALALRPAAGSEVLVGGPAAAHPGTVAGLERLANLLAPAPVPAA